LTRKGCDEEQKKWEGVNIDERIGDIGMVLSLVLGTIDRKKSRKTVEQEVPRMIFPFKNG